MLNITKIFLAFFIILGTCAFASAVEDESIIFNQTTGNYLINHYSPLDKKFEQLIFIPATKINPTLSSKLKLEESVVHYEFKLVSGQDSQQNIVHIILDPVSSVTSSLPDIPLNAPPGKIMGDMISVANYFDTPKPWLASLAYSDGQMSFRVGWRTLVAQGMNPGGQAIFGFNSHDLPGIIQAEIFGYAPDSQDIDGEEIPDSPKDAGEDPFWKQYFSLLQNNYVPRLAAVPVIAVPDPFDPVALLGSIQSEMHKWIGKNLLDTAFSMQLDRYFQSAIDAYRLNQPKIGKQQIKAMRELIKKEQPDMDRDEEHESDKNHEKNDDRRSALIDRLAARVLDFDLAYVTKRMGGDRND